jgi:4-amino-4-deoxy-L-arabinose transferase-like glycosyltransferase
MRRFADWEPTLQKLNHLYKQKNVGKQVYSMTQVVDQNSTEAPTILLAGSQAPTSASKFRWPRWAALGGVMLVSIFLNFYQLGQNGFGNTYYAAAVRSMLDSWHNFFFVSLDPGGFVSVDKPPLGFWLQVISAKVFGFTAFSILLPQALAGVVSVWLLYVLVRRHFGTAAGLLAGLALALSPISVVTNRNNTIDSTLTLAMLVGAWAVLRAAETGKLRWLLVCAAMVGVGFNIKMLEAYLVVPAYALLYLLAAPRRIWVRIVHLLIAGVLMVVLSLAWVVAVDLTPASARPYVGSSGNNSALNLALGYNGVARLVGNTPSGGSGAPTGGQPPQGAGSTSGTPGGFGGPPPFQGGNGGPPQGGPRGSNGNAGGPQGGQGGGQVGMFNTGNPGLTRLFTEPLGSQIAWLLPLAILGALAVAWQRRPRPQRDRQQHSLILWGTWLLTMGVFFSVASFFHQYYLTVMAPAICALFGIGLVVMWRDYRRGNWRGWLLPIAIALTAIQQITLLNSYSTWAQWMVPLIATLAGISIFALVAARLLPRLRLSARLMQPLALAVGLGVVALLVTPTVWAATPVLENVSTPLPIAGPDQTGGAGGGQFAGNGVDSALISYLEAHQGTAKYLVAVPSAQTADAIILATNEPVMALGGFNGGDQILTVAQLKALIANGTIHYFLVGGGGGPGGGSSSLINWITANCTAVSYASSSTTSSGTSGSGPGAIGNEQLYYCSSAAAS